MPLSDTETRIIKMVVERFMKLKDATKRKDLVTEFRSPQAVDRLISLGILRVLDNEGNLVPSALGVDCSEDSDSVTRAKKALGIVLQALQNLYDVTPARKQITRNDVLMEVNRIQGNTVPEVIERGLYFVKEFSVLDSYGPSPGRPRPTVFDLEWMVISENVITVDVKNAWDDHIRGCRATMESITSAAERAAPRYSQAADDDRTAKMNLPAATQSAAPRTGFVGKRWDIFISHASEDKEEIARSLAEALTKRGFEVWYDDFALKLGDSLRESINRGLAESRFGVVILSKHFFAKHWPNQELSGLAAIEVCGEKVILPVWHGVTHADVVAYSPILADRKAVSSEDGLEKVVTAIQAVVNPPISEGLHEKLRAAEEIIQEYHCPYCGSPLSERTSVQLSEHDDGMLEAFECGYSHIDGHIQRPCPSDPKFPRLSDYDFIYEEVRGDSLWKWKCFANGKTKEARLLNLMPGLGRTKEEAHKRVVDWHKTYAKQWKR
jgi:TIR domain